MISRIDLQKSRPSADYYLIDWRSMDSVGLSSQSLNLRHGYHSPTRKLKSPRHLASRTR
jgi:hypothetical protein